MPAAFSLASTSFEVRPCSFAISWTRFLAISQTSLRARRGRSRSCGARAQAGVLAARVQRTPEWHARRRRDRGRGRRDRTRRPRRGPPAAPARPSERSVRSRRSGAEARGLCRALAGGARRGLARGRLPVRYRRSLLRQSLFGRGIFGRPGLVGRSGRSLGRSGLGCSVPRRRPFGRRVRAGGLLGGRWLLRGRWLLGRWFLGGGVGRSGARARNDLGHVLVRALRIGERRDLGRVEAAEHDDLVGVEAAQRLVGVEAAVAGPGQRRVRAATAGRHDRGAAARDLLLVVAVLGFLGRELGLRLDVHAPPRQAGGQAGVLTLAADGQRELVVGDDHRRLAAFVVDQDLAHAGRRQGLGDEPGRLVVVGDDVDLLAPQLGDDHPDPGAARADARPDGVHAVGMGDDRDLRAVAGLARDVGDLHQAVGDLGHLQLEQLLDELGVATRDDDAGALGRGRDLLDDRLDAAGVLVALGVYLLGLGQQGLHALAELYERVARVRLLHDAGDQLADAVAVLLEHHVALGLADALQDHLLHRLGGDAAEVARGDIALLDLVAVLLELLGVDLGVLGLAGLPRLGVDHRALVDGLDDELGLEALGDQELVDGEVAGLAVHLDAGVLGGARRLLVCGQQRVLEREEELVRRDALLAGERGRGFQDLLGHD